MKKNNKASGKHLLNGHSKTCGCDGQCNCQTAVGNFPHKHLERISFNEKQNNKPAGNTAPVLGFYSISDFAVTTLMGKASGKFLFISGLLGGLTSFITSYIWDDAKAVYFLMALIALDGCTGIVNALRAGTFKSSRLPRILGIMVTYVTVLSMGWHTAKYAPSLDFLPGVLYLGFTTVLLVSIIENLSAMGVIPKELSQKILDLIKKK